MLFFPPSFFACILLTKRRSSGSRKRISTPRTKHTDRNTISRKDGAVNAPPSLLPLVCVFFNCQQLIPCRNVANSFALILRGAPRQLPFTADERVCRRQLHYLFIIYDSISSDNGGRNARTDSPTDDSSLPFYQLAPLYLFDGIWINRKLGFYLEPHKALTYWNII